MMTKCILILLIVYSHSQSVTVEHFDYRYDCDLAGRIAQKMAKAKGGNVIYKCPLISELHAKLADKGKYP